MTLSINQQVAEYAAKRLGEFTSECRQEVEAFILRARERGLADAMVWIGDEVLAAEHARGSLHDVRVAVGEIHRGDYDTDALRELDRCRSVLEQRLLNGPDPLSFSSGGPCRVAAKLAELAGHRRAYHALTVVYRDAREHEAKLHDAARPERARK